MNLYTASVFITLLGLSKNLCECKVKEPIDEDCVKQEEPVDEEAIIHVEEWRLHKVQSPIEFNHSSSVHHEHFDPLEFHGHWDKGGIATVKNNGYTATLTFQNRQLPFLKGGPLQDDFVFAEIHFHWSDDDDNGCEHIFEDKACSMEAHIVHFNKKYGDFQSAKSQHDGLAVVAIFLLATDDKENTDFAKLSHSIQKITKKNTVTKAPSDCLTWIKETAQCKGYYTYQGSLTTKPYTESVTWILYTQPIHISRKQVAIFRKLTTQNIRPVQTPPEHKKLNIIYVKSHKDSE